MKEPRLTYRSLVAAIVLTVSIAVLTALQVWIFTDVPINNSPSAVWTPREHYFFWCFSGGIFGFIFFWLLANLRDRVGPIIAMGCAVTGGLTSGTLAKGFYMMSAPIPVVHSVVVGAIFGTCIAIVVAFLMRSWSARAFGGENSWKRPFFYGLGMSLVLSSALLANGSEWSSLVSCVAVTMWGIFYMSIAIGDATQGADRGAPDYTKWYHAAEISVATGYVFVSLLRFGSKK